MWKSIVERGRPHDSIIRHMRTARWITDATHTHLEYVILIALHSNWLRERVSMLRHTYGACLVNFCVYAVAACWEEGLVKCCSVTADEVVQLVSAATDRYVRRMAYCDLLRCKLLLNMKAPSSRAKNLDGTYRKSRNVRKELPLYAS